MNIQEFSKRIIYFKYDEDKFKSDPFQKKYFIKHNGQEKEVKYDDNYLNQAILGGEEITELEYNKTNKIYFGHILNKILGIDKVKTKEDLDKIVANLRKMTDKEKK